MKTTRHAALRWQLASHLNRLPGMCWANLVSWALRSISITETRQDWICRADFDANGCCYCTKLRTPEFDKAMRATTTPPVNP
jgi:hypothetical protein